MNRIIALLLLSACLASAETKFIGKDPISGMSQAVVVDGGPLIHTAQLFGVDRKGKLVGGDDVAKQSAQVLENITEALKRLRPAREW